MKISAPASARHGQIVHVERVLRAHVAAGDAIAAIGAGLLFHAEAVIRPMLEIDRDRDRRDVRPELLGARLQRLELLQGGRSRVRLRTQHFGGALVIGQQFAARQRARPPGEREHLLVRNQRHVGIHQGRAAEAVALDHRDVAVVQQFVKPQRIHAAALLLQVAVERVGEVARLPLAAALQNADRRFAVQVAVASRAAVIAPP